MTAPTGPTYELARLKSLVKAGRYAITIRAAQDARSMHFEEQDIVGCVLAVREDEFHKAMPSQTVTGSCQDVYYTTWCGTPVYLKLQITARAETIVISFHQNTSR